MNPNINLNEQDAQLVQQIIDRYVALMAVEEPQTVVNTFEIQVSLATTHLNGCPLDLPKLLAGSDATLQHDIFGIKTSIDLQVGNLRRKFVPRCKA